MQFEAKPSAEKRGEMSLEDFLRRDWDELGDGLKYEWCDGFVEAGEENMHPDQGRILIKLQDQFNVATHHRAGARILNEMEIRSEAISSYRKADVVVYSGDQVAMLGTQTIPPFVIEVISEFDNAIHHTRKLNEYFASGVEVFWQIFPDDEAVFVWVGKQCTICTGEEICSASPAFPDFEIEARRLFS